MVEIGLICNSVLGAHAILIDFQRHGAVAQMRLLHADKYHGCIDNDQELNNPLAYNNVCNVTRQEFAAIKTLLVF